MLDVDLEAMSSAVCISDICVKGCHLVAHLVDDRHARELQRAELAVERVDGVAILALGDALVENSLRDLLRVWT